MVQREENDEPRVGLPPLPGTYALVLRFSRRMEIVVGRLGVLETQPGYYVYVGSALGPGGLAACVGRHCRREKTRRWHVDYLREAAQIEEVWYATGRNHRECRWARALSTLPGASMPLTGFGASDCGCPSHLCFFTLPPSVADFRKKLRGQRIERKCEHDTHMRVVSTPEI
jgi:Uri superfamily endonuclease